MAETGKSKRVAAIVFNSVNRDTRVLKEADSLARFGYQITVFGIQDVYCNEAENVRESGARIRRVDWLRVLYKLLSQAVMGGLIIMLGLFVLSIQFLYGSSVPKGDLLLAGSLFIGLVGIPFYLRARKRHRERANSDQGAPLTTAKSVFEQLGFTAKRLAVMSIMTIAVSRAVEAFKPDVIHCHDLTTVPAGYRNAKRLNCKLIYDSHEIYEEQSGFGRMTGWVFRLIQKYYSPKVSAFITINDSIGEFLQVRYPALPRPVIIRNATMPLRGELFYDGRLHRAAGLKPDRKILLYQGGFAPRRGLEILVNSSVLLPEDWCLVMMGWGSLEGALRRITGQIDEKGNRVRFVPAAPHDELVNWTAGGTLGIIPYQKVGLNNWYCSPNKLWEYANAGVPVLVSPFPEMVKTVEHHAIGWLLDADLTQRNIAAKVISLTDDDLRRAKAATRRFVASDNWTVYEKRLVDLYNALVPV